eukprot:7476601-Pyramimonas_sp.AAC.1
MRSTCAIDCLDTVRKTIEGPIDADDIGSPDQLKSAARCCLSCAPQIIGGGLFNSNDGDCKRMWINILAMSSELTSGKTVGMSTADWKRKEETHRLEG